MKPDKGGGGNPAVRNSLRIMLLLRMSQKRGWRMIILETWILEVHSRSSSTVN